MRIKKSCYLLIVGLFVFSAGLNAYAQCVQCVPAPPGWMCMGATRPAGDGCVTDGLSCTLIGTCNPEINDLAGKDGQCSVKALKNPQVNIPDSLIREVARVDVNAAFALINVRNLKVEFTRAKVSLAPIELTADDVEKRLTLPDYFNSEYFKELRTKAFQAFGKGEPVVFEIFLNKDDPAPNLLVNSGSSKSSLELRLSKSPQARGDDSSTTFEAVLWKSN